MIDNITEEITNSLNNVNNDRVERQHTLTSMREELGNFEITPKQSLISARSIDLTDTKDENNKKKLYSKVKAKKENNIKNIRKQNELLKKQIKKSKEKEINLEKKVIKEKDENDNLLKNIKNDEDNLSSLKKQNEDLKEFLIKSENINNESMNLKENFEKEIHEVKNAPGCVYTGNEFKKTIINILEQGASVYDPLKKIKLENKDEKKLLAEVYKLVQYLVKEKRKANNCKTSDLRQENIKLKKEIEELKSKKLYNANSL